MRCLCSTSSITTLHRCCDSSMGSVNIARKGLLHAAAGVSHVMHVIYGENCSCNAECLGGLHKGWRMYSGSRRSRKGKK